MGKSGSSTKASGKKAKTEPAPKPAAGAEAAPARVSRAAASTPTRISADIADAAAAVGATEHRSAAEQINHWARVGMEIERSNAFDHRRVLAVAAGQEQSSTLTPDERAVAHALINARIKARAADEHFGAAARARGETTVSLDDEGRIVEIAPDGTRKYL
jgi:hypothetical protein